MPKDKNFNPVTDIETKRLRIAYAKRVFKSIVSNHLIFANHKAGMNEWPDHEKSCIRRKYDGFQTIRIHLQTKPLDSLWMNKDIGNYKKYPIKRKSPFDF